MGRFGSNRWFFFKPSLGVSKTEGPWTLEAVAAATIFTDNDDIYGDHTREQDPICSAQAHVIRSFPKGIWASVAQRTSRAVRPRWGRALGKFRRRHPRRRRVARLLDPVV
jgi:hypothetical protein